VLHQSMFGVLQIEFTWNYSGVANSQSIQRLRWFPNPKVWE